MNKFERVSEAQFNKDCINFGLNLNVENVKLPIRATKLSAGYDIYSVIDFVLEAGQGITLPTGLKVQLDSDKFLAIFPRSGLGFKYKFALDNTVGIIDADYYNNLKNEGHILVKMTNEGIKTLTVKSGEAICQGIIMQRFVTEDDNATGERVGGFGSTTKQ